MMASMPRKRAVEQYEHKGKTRANNPPVGLVDAASEPPQTKKNYAYDPHLDPSLQWAGKAERTSFDVPTVSLHVHERIDPRSIIEAVRQKNGNDFEQLSLFNPAKNPPLREAVEFYKHKNNWSNRLIAGDSLLVMNSLIEKETLAGQVQMVYFDPPYGIKYGSNFQPFINKRDVKDGKDEDLTSEPEMLRAFRDTWELGIHSYLTFLRDRLLLMRELLHESGSIFVQISDENVHHVREIMDDVFRRENFVSLIAFVSTSGFDTSKLARTGDYVIWYAKDHERTKYRQLFAEKDTSLESGNYRWLKLPEGKYRGLTAAEFRSEEPIPPQGKLYQPTSLVSQGATSTPKEFEYQGKAYMPPAGQHWKTTVEGLHRLGEAGRIHVAQNSIRYVRFADDFPYQPITNLWTDTATGNFTEEKIYVVQTSTKVIQRCLLMTTDPGDLVMDVTCGSGTTAIVAEQWGRRWITCDTSRVALTLAKQRLLTALFDYYQLAHPDEGVGSGFKYETVPHITLKSIANKEPPTQETLYDQPLVDNSKTRVTGPFTVEAVPAPNVKSFEEISGDEPTRHEADESIARSGETLRQNEWRNELLRSGIRGKNGQFILFSRVEPLAGTHWLHAIAETKADDRGAATVKEEPKPERVVISFGPEYAPLEQKQVELAIEEARSLDPKPRIIVFAAFQFDPEAAKDIDEMKSATFTLLKAQMNADLLTDDLKKKRASNESFWLVGQPDVEVETIGDGADKGKRRVHVNGFDYYNTKTGGIESGGADRIAMWMLDTNYDGRSLFPRQVFFPMAGDKEGWAKLARNLKAEIDEELITAYRGTVSLPFTPGDKKRAAVKIIDDRGIECLKLVDLA
jgi:adenine-specific DNA-methyltransferase